MLGMSNGNVYFTLHKYDIACAISKPNAILYLYVCQYYNIVLAIIQISTDKNKITTHSYDKQVYRFNFDTCKNCRRRRGQKFYTRLKSKYRHYFLSAVFAYETKIRLTRAKFTRQFFVYDITMPLY